MVITEEIMNAGKSRHGSWSGKQLRVLGVHTAHNPGWRKKIVGSDIPGEKVALFLMLKDKHLRKDADQILMFEAGGKVNADSFAGGNKYNCGTCFHHKSGNCDDLPDDRACVHWFSPDTNVRGIAYGKAIG